MLLKWSTRPRPGGTARDHPPDARVAVSGDTAAWLDAVIDRSQTGLATGGDWRLPRDLLGGLRKALCGGRR